LFFYNAYGLRIRSDFPFPQLLVSDCDLDNASAISADVFIHLQLDSSLHTDPPGKENAYSDISRESAVLIIRGLGTFYIRRGREITIQPHRHFDEQMIQAVIINAVMAIVLFQRKTLVFHASCVKINDTAIAFLGTSGAGKSLIAGALVARGHYLVTEDVAPVYLIGAQPYVYPGYPMIRMKPQDSAMLGLSHQCNKLLHAKEQRCQCFVRDSFTALPCPLRYIFVLAVNERRKIQRLSSKESFMELISHSPPAIWNLLPDQLHFFNIGKLIKKVPVFRVTREECLEALPQHAHMIEEYFCKNTKFPVYF